VSSSREKMSSITFIQLTQVANVCKQVYVHYTEHPVLKINVFKTSIVYKIIPVKKISNSSMIFFFI